MHGQRLGELEEGRPDSDGAENTHGLVSTNEWTGVPLRFLIDLVGKDRGSTWMLAEGGDGAAVDRSIPLTDEIVDEAFVA
jgi:sulfane dehydrogenase subunit SoxC